MGQSLNVCPKFWKDIKRTKSRDLSHSNSEEYFSKLSDIEKTESFPVVQNIVTLIQNSIEGNILDQQSDKYFTQPFLTKGWVIRKLRWAVDNRGKRDGLRVLFAVNNNDLIMILIATKNDCADEKTLQKEIITRLKDYLDV